MWMEYDSTSWMMKTLILLTGLHVPLTLDGIKPLGQQNVISIPHCHVAPQTDEPTDVLIQIWDGGFKCSFYYIF